MASRIDRLLGAKPPAGLAEELSAQIEGARRLNDPDRRRLRRWQQEIAIEGELAWLDRHAPAPSAHDRAMLAHLKAVIPGARGRTYFMPFKEGQQPSLLASVVGGAAASGVAHNLSGVPVTIIDARLPPISRWLTTIHELIHSRQVLTPSAAEAMSRLVRAGAGNCETPGDEAALFSYLVEGVTQRQTLQVFARLLRAGRESKERATVWGRFLAVVGAVPGRGATPDEIAGEAMLADFRELGAAELQRLERLAPPEAARRLDRGYAERLGVVAAAARDPQAAAALMRWIERGDAAPYYSRLGRERIVLASQMARLALVYEQISEMGELAAPVLATNAATPLMKRLVQPGATGELRGRALDAVLAAARAGSPASSSPSPAHIASWRRDYACRPLAVGRAVKAHFNGR